MKRLLCCLLLLAVCAWAYAPVADNGFVNFDDNKYLTENPVVQRGLTAEGLRWAFDNRQTANFHPLTWLSHMLDVELFGMAPGAHHLSSLALHALATCALFLALARLGLALAPALVVALLFAVHPLRVESVAWAAERKDVLAGLFFALALLAWAGYARAGGAWRYALVAGCLLLGLSAKAMLVTLPVLLLLLDAWPLRRHREHGWRRLVLEKLPLLALVALFAGLALRTQSAAGAVRSADQLALGARVANACATTWIYVGKTLLPRDLAVFYPHPALVEPGWRAWNAQALGGLAALVVTTAVAWSLRRRAPQLLLGWAWFLVMLAPVSGLVQIGEQAWADRYAYLPTVGLYVALAVTLAALVRGRGRAPLAPVAAVAAALLVLAAVLVLGLRTRAQVRVWRDSETLFRHALRVTERNALAHFSLGAALLARGRLTEARPELEAAAALDPEHANTHYDLGIVLQAQGEAQAALAHFRRTVELAPGHVEAHVNLGLATGLAGDYPAALAHFEEALRLAPANPRGHASLGLVARRAGDLERARIALREALRLDPRSSSAHYELGRLLEDGGAPAAAARHYRAALDARPGHADAARRLARIEAQGLEDGVR